MKAELVTDMNKYFGISSWLPLHLKQVIDYLQSIFIVFQDGDFLSITLLVPGLYKIQIQLLKSTPEDGFVYPSLKQILDIFIFQSKDLG